MGYIILPASCSDATYFTPLLRFFDVDMTLKIGKIPTNFATLLRRQEMAETFY